MRRSPVLAISLAAVGFCLPSAAPATIITINPATNIQATINAAANGDTIRFTAGTYNQIAIVTGKSLTFDSVGGAENTIWTAANLTNTVLQINNAPSPGVVIRGLTLRDGVAPGTANTPEAYPHDGGGISAANSVLVIENCRFINNRAGDDGGAISSNGAAVTIVGTAFEYNVASPTQGYGGALVIAGTLTITDCSFSNNQALGGGGVFIRTGSPAAFTGTTFTANTSSTDGGAVANSTSSGVAFTGCHFVDNVGAGRGGAIWGGTGGTVTVNRCTFTGNTCTTTTSDGGAINAYNGVTLTIDQSTFTRNRCRRDGGALVKGGPTGGFTVTRSAFFGNFAANGGAVRTYASAQVSNGVFVGNEASTYGGALYAAPSAGMTFDVRQCTFVSNLGTESVVAGVPTGGGVSTFKSCVMWANASLFIQAGHSITYSDVQQASGVRAGAGNINLAPLFAADPKPGDDNDWGTADDDYGDLLLVAGSPGIDAGDSPSALSFLLDYAGQNRNVDDPATPNTGLVAWALNVDMGAYEYIPEAGCPGDFNGDGGVDGADVEAFFARWESGC